MKNLLIAFVLLFVLGNGCKKNDAAVDTPSSSTEFKQPTADFSIINLNPAGYVTEGRNLKFNVTASNATTYSWDFGNGMKFDGKTPPANISYIPCGGNYTITLTTANLYGKTATYSKSFGVLCSGRNTHGQHLPD